MNFTIDKWNHFSKKNAIEMVPTHNDGKYVIAERFIRNLKEKL